MVLSVVSSCEHFSWIWSIVIIVWWIVQTFWKETNHLHLYQTEYFCGFLKTCYRESCAVLRLPQIQSHIRGQLLMKYPFLKNFWRQQRVYIDYFLNLTYQSSEPVFQFDRFSSANFQYSFQSQFWTCTWWVVIVWWIAEAILKVWFCLFWLRSLLLLCCSSRLQFSARVSLWSSSILDLLLSRVK